MKNIDFFTVLDEIHLVFLSKKVYFLYIYIVLKDKDEIFPLWQFQIKKKDGLFFQYRLMCYPGGGDSDISIYTQKKKFSQYLCFLIKSTILNISLSNFLYESHYRNSTCTCLLRDEKNSSIRLYQPNFKMHDVHVLR